MAEDKNKNTVPGPDDIIQFADDHRVSIQAGDYNLSVKQTVKSEQNGKTFSEQWSTEQNFSVLSERFDLPPNAIRSQFPPAGNSGDYWHIFPHIVLERSTLPWERSASSDHDIDPLIAPSWLALLVFHANDPLPKIKVENWATLRKEIGLPVEKSEQDADQVKVIEIDTSLAKKLIPSQTELNQLTHVRRRLSPTANGDKFSEKAEAISFVRSKMPKGAEFEMEEESLPGGYIKGWLWRCSESEDSFEILQKRSKFLCYSVAHEAATVLANRLPLPGSRNQVHLVSFEGRYAKGNFEFGSDPTIKLVSLFNWDFYCEKEEKTFKGLLENLNKDENGREYASAWRLPLNRISGTNKAVVKAIKGGWVPLRHRFREGSRSVSWYHGPFAPREVDTGALARIWGKGEDTLQIRHADQLVLYDADMGMYDVSYAAAWELGRLLTLQNTRVALQLLHWKRQHAHQLHAVRHLADYGYHLPISRKANQGETDFIREKAIWKWLDELTLLQHIPFTYLVPDEDLIPQESIHFFTVDRRWVECLRDGAYSIGRVLEKDAAHDDNLAEINPVADQLPAESGFILRSEIVAGWPDLQITAFNKREAPEANGSLPDPGHEDVMVPVRKELVAPNVLLVLYPGDIKSVDFFLPPETLHFGLDTPEQIITSDEPEKLIKRRRSTVSGKELKGQTNLDKDLHFVDFEKRIINISALSDSLIHGAGHAGTLALQLVAGTTLVRFIRPTS